MFVANYDDSNVSVIFDSIDVVVATVKNVGTRPTSVAEDSDQGEVYESVTSAARSQ